MMQIVRFIDKTVCYVDKEDRFVTCFKKIDTKCEECSFCQKYKGREERHFFYTKWAGITNKNKLKV